MTTATLQPSPNFKPSFVTDSTKSKKITDTDFNFDLDRMKKAVNAKSFKMPESIKTFEEFDAWMNCH